MNELKSNQQTEGIKCSKGNSVTANNKSCDAMREISRLKEEVRRLKLLKINIPTDNSKSLVTVPKQLITKLSAIHANE